MLGVKQPAVWFAFGVYHNSSHGNITLCTALGLEARCLSGSFSHFLSLSLFLSGTPSVSFMVCLFFTWYFFLTQYCTEMLNNNFSVYHYEFDAIL